MALPFTEEQREEIRAQLIQSAQKHALTTGVRKTSLDMLTADAGISKSSFYKFYDTKEQLFWEAAELWERELLVRAHHALEEGRGAGDKTRAAAMVYTVFRTIHELGIARFLREDMPLLAACLPENVVREHIMTSAKMLFYSLQAAHIRFTAPEDTVSSVIQLMYLSILNMNDIGEHYFPALYELVAGACDRLVA